MEFGVIGCGKLGLSLIELLESQGKLQWVVARSDNSKLRVKEFINSDNIFSSVTDIDTLPEIVFICVNDKAIEDVSDTIASHFVKTLNGKYIIHCSGFLNTNILNKCRILNAVTASLHPFQTFFFPSKENFNNIAWGVECNETDYDFFADLIKSFNGKPFFLDKKTINIKPLYHTVAVSASNYLTSVICLSAEIAREIKLPTLDFIKPIIEQTVKNNLTSIEHLANIPLTGPIARGDADGVKLHIEALSAHPDLLLTYKHFAFASSILAHSAGILSSRDYILILNVLKETFE